MKLTVKESFEQGLPRKIGGMLKLSAGEYPVERTDAGITLSVAGKPRLIPTQIVERLIKLGLVAVA